MKTTLYIFLVLILFSACDSYEQDDYTTEYVVESYLIAGESLPIVKLSETSPINASYHFEDYAVEGATVMIMLMDGKGRVEDTFRYAARERGVYEPLVQHDVLPLRRYALEVVPPGEREPITASTVVPGMFFIEALHVDTIVYQQGEALAVNMSQSTYPDRPAIYINKVESLDTTYALTPLYQDLVDDNDLTKEDLIDNSSGIMNEANFEFKSDGMLTLIVPWIGIAFYGPNDLVVDAVDDNVFDFVRSIEENGVRPLGERENVIDHVEGGRGIFGSLARARVQVFVSAEG